MNNTTRGMIFALVGAYIAYMGFQMYKNTVNGLSTMSMTTTILLMSLMILAGAGVIIYGIMKIVKDAKEQRQQLEESEQKEEEEEK